MWCCLAIKRHVTANEKTAFQAQAVYKATITQIDKSANTQGDLVFSIFLFYSFLEFSTLQRCRKTKTETTMKPSATRSPRTTQGCLMLDISSKQGECDHLS